MILTKSGVISTSFLTTFFVVFIAAFIGAFIALAFFIAVFMAAFFAAALALAFSFFAALAFAFAATLAFFFSAVAAFIAVTFAFAAAALAFAFSLSARTFTFFAAAFAFAFSLFAFALTFAAAFMAFAASDFFVSGALAFEIASLYAFSAAAPLLVATYASYVFLASCALSAKGFFFSADKLFHISPAFFDTSAMFFPLMVERAPLNHNIYPLKGFFSLASFGTLCIALRTDLFNFFFRSAAFVSM